MEVAHRQMDEKSKYGRKFDTSLLGREPPSGQGGIGVC